MKCSRYQGEFPSAFVRTGPVRVRTHPAMESHCIETLLLSEAPPGSKRAAVDGLYSTRLDMMLEQLVRTGEHWWCQCETVAMELFPLLAFSNASQQLGILVGNQLRTCRDCDIRYVAALRRWIAGTKLDAPTADLACCTLQLMRVYWLTAGPDPRDIEWDGVYKRTATESYRRITSVRMGDAEPGAPLPHSSPVLCANESSFSVVYDALEAEQREAISAANDGSVISANLCCWPPGSVNGAVDLESDLFAALTTPGDFTHLDIFEAIRTWDMLHVRISGFRMTFVAIAINRNKYGRPSVEDGRPSSTDIMHDTNVYPVQLVVQKTIVTEIWRELSSANQDYIGMNVTIYPLGSMSSHFRRVRAAVRAEHFSPMFPVLRRCIFFTEEWGRGIHWERSLGRIRFPESPSVASQPSPDLASAYNASQLKAIKLASRTLLPTESDHGDAFTLIQGPPGTGKTKTLLGILAVLLASTECATSFAKILVCAPSNVAVDTILTRAVSDRSILEALNGGKEKTRTRRLPDGALVRVGRNPSAKTKMYGAHEVSRRRNTRPSKVIDKAQVVFATLNTSADNLLDPVYFRYIIVDEACQAAEVDLFIPLFSFGAVSNWKNPRHIILFGDRCQLAPTVLSRDRNVARVLSRSLFEKLEDGLATCPICTSGPRECISSIAFLDTQYRMHPDIAAFPLQEMYAGRVKDGVKSDDRSTIYNRDPDSVFQPISFIDMDYEPSWSSLDSSDESSMGFREEEQQRQCGSFCNPAEAHVVNELLHDVLTKYPQVREKIVVTTISTVLSPYKAQLDEIDHQRSNSAVRGHRALTNDVPLKTIDSVQGQESDIVIISTVRSNCRGDIRFMSDDRRLNVDLTRAKCSLAVLGSRSTISKNEGETRTLLGKFMAHYERKSRLLPVSSLRR